MFVLMHCMSLSLFRCSITERNTVFCVDAHKASTLFLCRVFVENQWLCICIFASQNCQALRSRLTSDHVNINVCLEMVRNNNFSYRND